MQSSEKILRTCVHCGFCTATCPTYLLLGDELDSPRGRIYLMKDMLEGEARSKGGTVRVRETISRLSPQRFEAVWEAYRNGAWSAYAVESVTRRT